MRWREHGQPVGGGPMPDYAPFDSIMGSGPRPRAASRGQLHVHCEVRVAKYLSCIDGTRERSQWI